MQSNQPETLLRLWQVLGDRKTGTPPIVPLGKSAWWAGIAAGKYPKPVRLGSRAVAWRRSDIDRLIGSL
jgi:predicted DNA-binding transcriptional regulator AlpA